MKHSRHVSRMTIQRLGFAIAGILALLTAGLSGASEAAPGGGRSEAEITEALLVTHIHGITEEISRETVGVEGLPVILRLLHDPSFPRRDNLVGHLYHLAGDDAVGSLIAYLEGTVGDVTVPEEDRALLQVPQVLGMVAFRGGEDALSALLVMTDPDANDPTLARAARRAGRPDAYRRDLLRTALRGLALSGRPEARDRLRFLAGDAALQATGTLARDARRNLALLEELHGEGGGAPGDDGDTAIDSTDGHVHPGLDDRIERDGASLTVQVADTAGDAHDSGLSYANHADLTAPLTDQRLDLILADASRRMGTANFETDVSCCVRLQRSGTGLVFGAADDGLDVVETAEERDAVIGDGTARVKIVRQINYCSSAGSNIIGCANKPGPGMMVVQLSETGTEGILWAHEYGHNVGLDHNGGQAFIMYFSNNRANSGVTQAECGAYHAPPEQTGMTNIVPGACTDDDLDDVHDVLDNCPTVPNLDQADANGDGVGDACDFGCGNGVKEAGEACDLGDLGGESCVGRGFSGGDLACTDECLLDDSGCVLTCEDNDGDGFENCGGDCDDDDPAINPNAEEDCNLVDDDCDGTIDEGCFDSDGDGVFDRFDNCVATPNAGQGDADADGLGDACDICALDAHNDADGDDVCGDVDNCPETANASQTDGDADGAGDACDLCPLDPRNDADGDDVCGDVDNCPEDANADQRDSDGDGTGNVCEGPVTQAAPTDNLLIFPDEAPLTFSWDPAGMEQFVVEASKTTGFRKTKKGARVPGSSYTPDPGLWARFLKQAKRSGQFYWRVVGSDALGNRDITGHRTIRLAPPQAPLFTGPLPGTAFPPTGPPPTFTWDRRHNSSFKLVCSRKQNLRGKPRASAGKGFPLGGESWTPSADTWRKIVEKIAARSPDGEVFCGLYGRDDLKRRSPGSMTVFRILREER